ncbi:MAG: hypothetical protein J0I47_00865 [Sphingomonas sp.]|uniref:hypothetical protein n=1 Tax=Sphingomonas sp. TaxID=28214 RepID=UPI001AD03109|nr:hypothetical protein [Sphingomonas sp.]MBN8806780.1 hypothetical protein [Sphingomonas sp.]
MRTLLLLSVVALGGCAMTPQERAAAADRAARDQSELQRSLAGLTPGETTDCLPSRQQSSLKAYGDKLVYRVSPRLAYVSNTAGGCENVARGDILVTRSNQDRVCRGDIATTVDQTSRIPTGSCAIGSFTVWRK